MAKKLVIIDGYSLLFRAYYATAYGDPSAIMRTKSGIPTNAIFAFSNMLSKILSGLEKGDAIFIGLDAGGKTFRAEEFEEYKANRAEAPEDLKPQFAIVRELLDSLGISRYEERGIEADDICGSVAKRAGSEGYDVLIYTSDHDYLQLIDPHIKVSLLRTGLSNMELYDVAAFEEKYGIHPIQMIDLKGLAGDSSDNYPGIPGIGEKTATKLILEYGSLPAILEAAPTIKGKLGEKIVAGAEAGRLSYRLATIKTDVELPFDTEALRYQGYSFEAVNDFARKYELRQLLTRLPTALKKGAEDAGDAPLEHVKSLPASFAAKRIAVALDIDYTRYHEADPVGIAFYDGKSLCYMTTASLFEDAKAKAILADPNVSKIVYDGKATIYALRRLGLAIEGIDDDVLLAGYLLDSSLSSSPSEIYRSFGIDIDGEETALFSDDDSEKVGRMAFYAIAAFDKIEHALKENEAEKLYRQIEIPLSKVLAKMEWEGFPLHTEKLAEFGETFSAKKKAVEEEIYALAGERFNPNSPKQVATVLYDHLGLKAGKARGTSVSDLQEIEEGNPIVSKILEFRKYAKLLGTYVDGLVPHVGHDGKIHSYFNQAQTATGRLSSSSPNLQNISARDEESRQIRKAFYYDDPNIRLLSFDYSQIELRILACLSGDEEYQSLFQEGHDVHSETAKRIFHMDEITSAERRRAKAVNFAIIYGTTVYGLSEQIGTTPQEAASIIRAFYSSYPGVGAYLNSIIAEAEQRGYVTTMFGRRRYFREVNDPNFSKREAARRAAMNAPIQGSAADLIKIAMVKIDEFLSQGSYKTKMVLQIHDELIFAVPTEEIDLMKKELAERMEKAIPMPVPLSVGCGEGRTWYDAKD